MVKVCVEHFGKHHKGQQNITPGFYMDENLRKELIIAKKAIRQDYDMFLVVDGQEGSGKSRIAQQIGFFCDPTLTIDRVVFSAEEFKNAIFKADKYQCIIFDEAYGSLASRRAMSTINHLLVKMFAEMRQKNLFVILVLPSFFELDRYAAIHRSRVLIHVYHDRFQRGFFKMYSYKKKKIMYLVGKKNYNYNCVKASFRNPGRFTKFRPIDKAAYDRKKLKSFRDTQKEDSPKEKFSFTEIAFYILARKDLEMDPHSLYDLSERAGRYKKYLSTKLNEIEKYLLERQELSKNLSKDTQMCQKD